MEVIQLHIVPENTLKSRLSEYGLIAFDGMYSKSAFKKMIARNEVLVNGNVGKTGDWVNVGDNIELLAPKNHGQKDFKLNLEIVFEDDYMAVVNKPAGIPVSGNQHRTIQNALRFVLQPSPEQDALAVPRPAHRLDALTSGLLLIGKTSNVLLQLNRQFEEKSIKKKYVALVVGEIAVEGEIDTPIEEKKSFTRYQRKSKIKSLKSDIISLVELNPTTGRTHQLRKHLSGIGHPILGDELYTANRPLLRGKGLFLSAVSICFTHPKSEKEIYLEVPMPPKFKRRMAYEQKRWEKFN